MIVRSRAFVKTDGYFGPDRRRMSSAAYTGVKRRSTDQAAGKGRRDASSASAGMNMNR